MNKLKPRFKICFQKNTSKHIKLNTTKFNKKKWIFIKRHIKNKKEKKIEKKSKFFQQRLFEKQHFKFFYGCISEKKLKTLYTKLLKKINNQKIFEKLIILLERRLDITIFRLKLAKSIFHAKQLINHKKIKVNNLIINKSNFLLKKGDIIRKLK